MVIDVENISDMIFGMSTQDERLVSAAAAAELLDVQTETIYTYVTRGNLVPHRINGDRSSWFKREDVERLKARKRRRGSESPTRIATPDSRITLIEDGYYWYRGYDPAKLADDHSLEDVAELIWAGELTNGLEWSVDQSSLPGPVASSSALTLLDRVRLMSVELAVSDPLRYSTSTESILVIARRIMVGLVAGLPVLGDPLPTNSLASLLWPRLTTQPATPESLHVLNAALIVLADHGMAPATQVARTAAEYRADPHGIIEGALTVLAGGWHGGRSFSAEELIADIVDVGDAATVVGDRFRRQGRVASLGQRRYEFGDPRPKILLRFLRDAVPDHPVHDAYADLVAVVKRRALPLPAVELGLAALGMVFEFVPGSTEAIFAIGRSVGWLGHAIEGYEAPDRESPMFNYVGVRPFGPPPSLEE